MTDVIRGTAHRMEEMDVPADVLFALLSDWGAILDWFPKGEGDIPFERVEVIGTPGELPLARKVYRPGADPIIETLLLSDPGNRRIYYTVSDGSLPGIVNYVATNTVDLLDGDRCAFTLSCTFDIIDPALSADHASQFIGGFYSMIQRGFREYFAVKQQA